MSAPRALASAMILLRGVDQVVLAQRLAHRETHRGDEGIGDAAADDQLVDLADQVGEQFELGRRPWNRRRSRSAGAPGFPAPWPARRARPSATGRRRRPWRSGSRHACEAWARCAVPKASMHVTHRRARRISSTGFRRPCPRRRSCGNSPAAPAAPGATSTPSTQSLTSGTSRPSSSRQPRGDRRERILRRPHAFLRPAEVRGHHHRRALLQRQANRRQRRGDALLGGDATVLRPAR